MMKWPITTSKSKTEKMGGSGSSLQDSRQTKFNPDPGIQLEGPMTSPSLVPELAFLAYSKAPSGDEVS